MDASSEAEVRNCFVNCSKGEAKRMNLPADLATLPWDDLDFLGWRDPKAPQRAYIVVPWRSGLVGIIMRSSVSGRKSLLKSTMCSMCMTVHASSGVAVFVAPKAGAAGREGNTVGNYFCADLQCSLYVRGALKSEAATLMEETISLEAKIGRLQGKLAGFTTNVLGA